jgi:hypothetical protein
LIIPVFAVVGDTPEERSHLVKIARTQIAFYGSTPNYAFQFDDLGFEGTTAKLGRLMKEGNFPAMSELISDEMLDHYALVANWDDMADQLIKRYSAIATRIVSYLTQADIRRRPEHFDRWAEIARAVASGP